MHYYKIELRSHPTNFPGNKSRIIHSENIYHVPGNVLVARVTKKKNVVPASKDLEVSND